MRRFVLSSLLALSACATSAPVADLRDQTVRISSIAAFDAHRISGLWHEVAGFPLRAGCSGGLIGLTIEATGKGCYLPLPAQGGALTVSGPGRLTTARGLEMWVLWVDGDYRTLVLGDPSGSFGAILNRDGAISADRLSAARKVLAFNGYDLTGLQED